MNPEVIKEILSRFYESANTEQEEQMLRQYFLQEDVDESLKEEKVYFEAMYSMNEMELSENFDDRLFEKLVDAPPKRSSRIGIYSISGIAATIAIFLSIWFGTDLLKPKEVYGTINDPIIAFAETKKALDEVSKKMNQGLKPVTKTASKVEKNVQKAGEVKKIDAALKKTESLKKINETMDFIKEIHISFGG